VFVVDSSLSLFFGVCVGGGGWGKGGRTAYWSLGLASDHACVAFPANPRLRKLSRDRQVWGKCRAALTVMRLAGTY
jgi:hypothetical protein